MESASGDEEHVIGSYHTVTRVDVGPLDDRQEVALYPLAGDVRAVASRIFAGSDLVDLVEEYDTGLLDPLEGFTLDLRAVDELLLLFGEQDAPRLPHLHQLARFLAHHPAEHVLEVDTHGLHALRREHLQGRHTLFGDLELHLLLFQHAVSEGSLECPATLLQRGVRNRGRADDQQVQQPILGRALGANLDLAHPFFADQLDGRLHKITDDRFDVAAHIADLGELRGLDLEKRGACEACQPARDLGLAHPGRADHDDVLRCDLLAQLRRQLLPPPAVAQGHRHRPLGGVLPDDETVELGHDPLRGQFVKIHKATPRL